MASSRRLKPLQSPSSSTIAKVSRSGGSGSAGSSAGKDSDELSPGTLMAKRALAGPVVGFDDAGDEIAAHHVPRREADGLDAAHAGQQPHRLFEARALTRRQIDLARVAGHHHLRAFANTGQEHLH